ncbi:FG-GAP and VCBS repeat-containing protein [Nocardiopsis sp. NPDC049922]|uniref:VCBS repeat-containing protein n=1 Tax=Nocardiopsis sp. NPDC049922 TaxID=3155157 RepID=UPI0033D60C88
MPPAPAARLGIVAALFPLAAAGCAGPADTPPPPQERPSAAPGPYRPQRADFDGDGFDDVVVTVPSATVDGAGDAGYLAVVPGSADGPDPSSARTVSRADDGVPGEPTEADRFGRTAHAGDLDGDGYADLVVGAARDRGPLVLWGSADGLGSGVPLGERTAYGVVDALDDFDGDGHPDLLYVDSEAGGGAGGLRFMYGPFSRDGAPDRTATELTAYVDTRELRVISGDLNGDGRADVVGFPAFEEMAYETPVWLGSSEGLVSVDPLPEADEGTVADVDGDGYGDLVLRVLTHGTVEDPPNVPSEIMVVHGSADGPGERRATLTLDTEGVPGEAADGDQFGFELASGDVDGDGYADVVAGVARPGPTAPYDAGDVVVLRGGAEGLTGDGALRFGPEEAGVSASRPVEPEWSIDPWPLVSIRTLDSDGDGVTDVVVGRPLRDDDGYAWEPGPVWAFRGTDEGLTGVLSFTLAEIGAATGRGFGYGQSFAH